MLPAVPFTLQTAALPRAVSERTGYRCTQGTKMGGMAIEIPTNLTPELVPFAWLLGTWEGTGTMWYEGQENTPFGQIITFEQDGLPFIEYRAESFLLDDEGQKLRPITVEPVSGRLTAPSPTLTAASALSPRTLFPPSLTRQA